MNTMKNREEKLRAYFMSKAVVSEARRPERRYFFWIVLFVTTACTAAILLDAVSRN